jgi:hypothetical protein
MAHSEKGLFAAMNRSRAKPELEMNREEYFLFCRMK